MLTKLTSSLLALGFGLGLTSSCSDANLDFDLQQAQRGCSPTPLRADLAWYGENLQTLDAWIASEGCTQLTYNPNDKPLALLDWDNTVVKNDVGDAVTFYVIKHDLVRQPPDQNWKLTSAYMTDEGAAALTAACGTDVPAGERLPTS